MKIGENRVKKLEDKSYPIDIICTWGEGAPNVRESLGYLVRRVNIIFNVVWIKFSGPTAQTIHLT